MRRLLVPLSLAMAALSCALGCTKPKAMDVLWSNDLVDDNALARNPVWSQMKQTGQPPDACAFCPCQDENPVAWSSAANCTDASLTTNSSGEGFGHWNWLPVEYEGIVTWGGHSNSWYDDDDYYMEVKRDDRSLETATRDGMHIEFDSEETVDYWDDTNTWWDDFHHHFVDDNDQAASGRINGKFAIVVGLLGLDNRHGVHSELNPVYAMFVHVQDDSTNDRWAFFVKNWGNEGYFGDNEEYLAPIAGNKLRIRISHPGATGFSLSDNVFAYGDDEAERNQESWTAQPVSGGGMLLTFSLRDPSKQVGFVGDLTIAWRGGATPQATIGAASQLSVQRTTKDDEGDTATRAKVARLSAADRQMLAKAVNDQRRRHVPARTVKGVVLTSQAPEPAKPAASKPTYGSIVRSTRDTALLARRAKSREIVRAFLMTHGMQ